MAFSHSEFAESVSKCSRSGTGVPPVEIRRPMRVPRLNLKLETRTLRLLSMFCPNCGNQNSADQKFCRSCGLGLQKIAESMSEQLPTKGDLSLQQKKERLEKLGVAALSVFGAGVAIPILWGIFYKMMYTQGKVLAGLGLLALIVILGCGLLSVILFAKANEVKETPANREPAEPPSLNPGQDTSELLNEARSQPPQFSVVDRTTELLANEEKRQR